MSYKKNFVVQRDNSVDSLDNYYEHFYCVRRESDRDRRSFIVIVPL